jgi:hypothetical protein
MTHEEIQAALHQAHLKHLGWDDPARLSWKDPFPPEECGNCAMYAEWVAPLLAAAWLQGVRTGTSRAMRRMSDEPLLPPVTEADNPYEVKP